MLDAVHAQPDLVAAELVLLDGRQVAERTVGDGDRERAREGRLRLQLKSEVDKRLDQFLARDASARRARRHPIPLCSGSLDERIDIGPK